MAKHGGFPMGGMGNMQQLMKQAQRMQENMQKKQAELNAQEFSASSGGGMVKVKVNGAREVLSVEIDPQCVDPDDVEMPGKTWRSISPGLPGAWTSFHEQSGHQIGRAHV